MCRPQNRDLANTEGRSDVLDNVIVLLPPTVFISSLSEHMHIGDIGSIGYVNSMYSTCTSNKVVLEMLYALVVYHNQCLPYKGISP